MTSTSNITTEQFSGETEFQIEIEQPSYIEDLNFNYLERIFSHLDVTDLINLINAHPQFNFAASFVLKRMCRLENDASCCIL